MKRSEFFQWLLVVVICPFLSCCQTLSEDDWGTEEKGRLNVKTRSTSNENLFYPLCLYAFSDKGDCEITHVVEDEDGSAQLMLPAGSYRIVALSGYSVGYDLPTVNNWDDVIELSGASGAEVPLMMGMADVTLTKDSDAKLEMNLSYSVTAVDVMLTNVPSDVSSVEVTLSPFYSSMSLKGEYKESGSSLKLACALNTANEWHTKVRYMFPGSGSETVLSITMKLKDGTETTYGYTWKDAPKANQPYHLKGSYSGGLLLDGSFVVTGWNEAEDVTFDFGAITVPDEEGEEEEETLPDEELSDLPEVGSIWNGSIVVDVGEVEETGVDILLMSLDEWAIVTSQVEELTSGYSVNGISGWRLPNYEEAQYLRDNFSASNRIELNERIADYDDELPGLDGEERYLCDKSNVCYSFIFAGGSKITKAGDKRSYYTRLVTLYRMAF